MLKELIDQYYENNQNSDRAQSRFYVTDAGKCPRAIFFKFKNAPREPMDARIMRIFEHGEHIHRNIFNILYRLKIGVTTEVPIPAQELISGRADAILCMNGENYVMDIKSMNSMIFKNMSVPKEENVYQIQLYLHYFEIKKGILFYVDKDRQDIKEFVINYDKKLVGKLLDKFKELKSEIDENTVPARLTGYPKNWQCAYCQFKKVCTLANGEKLNWESFKEKVQLGEKPAQEV